VAELGEVWRAQQNAPFPASCLPLSIEGVRLVKLDAAVGAILTGSLRTDGVIRPLEPKKRLDLERHQGLIARVLSEIVLDPESRAYFERLELLSAGILKESPP
jgi:hypothetical protein